VIGLAARIHDALPQTQCTRCGYPDCAGYAQAVADGAANINQCPPGGAEGIARLARLTGREPLPLDPQFGTEGPRAMAVIDEAWCIGCTLCLDACPTDAIVGINKRMHTVIEAHCTGCELCIPVCPVDCISLEVETPGRTGWQAWSEAQADAALQRYKLHGVHRRAGKQQADEPIPAAAEPQTADTRKRSIIEAALARARAASQQRSPAAKP
jgi:electron transport complex protein RnfB